jgi:hypothetical protein
LGAALTRKNKAKPIALADVKRDLLRRQARARNIASGCAATILRAGIGQVATLKDT